MHRTSLLVVVGLLSSCGSWDRVEIFAPEEVGFVTGCGHSSYHSGYTTEIEKGVWQEVYLMGSEDELSSSDLDLRVSFNISDSNTLKLKSNGIQLYEADAASPREYELSSFSFFYSSEEFPFYDGQIVLTGKSGYGASVDRAFSTKQSAITYTAHASVVVREAKSFKVVLPEAELNGLPIDLPPTVFQLKIVQGYVGSCGGF